MLHVLWLVFIITFASPINAWAESAEDASMVGDSRGQAGRAITVAQCLHKNSKKVRRLARQLERSRPKTAPALRSRLGTALRSLGVCYTLPIPNSYPMSPGSPGIRVVRAPAPKLRVSMGRLKINSGSVLTESDFTRALKRKWRAFDHCVKGQQKVQPRIAGSILFQVTVIDGRTRGIKIIKSSLTSTKLEDCWKTQIQRNLFPNSPGESVFRIPLKLIEM